jgi:hypothetical protein
VHQLIKEEKLDSVSVYNTAGQRIAHFITETSFDRRRQYRHKPGQWPPGHGKVECQELPGGRLVPIPGK